MVLRLSILVMVASTGFLANSQGTGSHTLTNTKASYTFEYNSTEAWLSLGTLAAGNRQLPFGKSSMWELTLRVDPEISVDINGNPAVPLSSESRRTTSEAGLSLTVIPINNFDFDGDGVIDPTVDFRWTGAFPDNDEGDSGGAAPQVRIDAYWALNGSRPDGDEEDFLRCGIVVQITNPTAETRYKIWSVKFPHLEICILDDDGEDRLATGRYGGLIHGNPIRFSDPHDTQGRGFIHQLERSDGLPDATATEPGVHTVPLWCYYTIPGGYGLYLAHNDDQGMFKGVYLRAKPEETNCATTWPQVPRTGTLEFEIVQYPHSLPSTGPGVPDIGIFQMVRYESPYAVFVGVFNGDWVDAAKKYRDYRLNNDEGRFAWLDDGSVPSGMPTNRFIPPELKTNPYQLRLQGGQFNKPWDGNGAEPSGILSPAGYCVDRLLLTSGELDTRDRLAFFEQEFAPGTGPGFPVLVFDRFPVTAEEVLYFPSSDTGAYQPSTQPVMSEVQLFLQQAGVRHHVLLDSMTEKFNHTEILDIDRGCTNPPGLWSCALTANYRRLCLENALIPFAEKESLGTGCGTNLPLLGYPLYTFPCTAGKASRLIEHCANCSSTCPRLPVFGYDPTSSDCLAGVTDVTGNPSSCAQTTEVIPCGARWSTAFSSILVGASQYLNVRGGLRTNAPATLTVPCFSRHHAHLPGFGSAVLDGWKEIFRSVRAQRGAQMGGVESFFFLPEQGGSTFSEIHRVQSPISLYFSRDIMNYDSDEVDRTLWNRYYDAPIWKIPLLQMVADEIRYVDQLGYASLGLPWTMLHGTSGADVEQNGCTNTRRFFHYQPSSVCTPTPGLPPEPPPVDFPAVPAALNCWAMTKRVFAHQSSILLDDGNMAASTTGDPFDIFDPMPTSTTGYAARSMLEYYKGLGLFLKAEDHMRFLTGTMERAPLVTIIADAQGSPVTETFAVPGSTLEASFKNLHNYFTYSYSLNGQQTSPRRPTDDLRFDKYRPVDGRIFGSGEGIFFNVHSNFAITTTPEEHESWLPHGMYRSWENDRSFMMFIGNPWGVKHPINGQTRPMNIFTFNFAQPLSSPASNTYYFRFTIDPTKYGFSATTPYTVSRARYGKNGNALPILIYGAGSGTRTFESPIGAFQYEAFRITFQ